MRFFRFLAVFALALFAGVVMAAGGKVEGPTRSGLEQKAKPPKIMSMIPDGWTQSLTEPRSDGAYSYMLTRKDSSSTTVVVRAEPARDRSANRRAADLAWDYGAMGFVVLEVEKAEDGRTLASATAVGRTGNGSVNVVRFGVRSPKTRPDLLVVVIASWNGDITPQLKEEIDLILLSATAE